MSGVGASTLHVSGDYRGLTIMYSTRSGLRCVVVDTRTDTLIGMDGPACYRVEQIALADPVFLLDSYTIDLCYLSRTTVCRPTVLV